MDLPQTGKWRFVDRLLDASEDSVTAELDVTEAMCEGHFERELVVPGVMMIEGMAQSMVLLGQQQATDGSGRLPVLVGLDRVRFRQVVRPPATLRFVVKWGERKGPMLVAHATTRVDGKRVCTAKLLATTVAKGDG